jgi:CHAD domain-containing protein
VTIDLIQDRLNTSTDSFGHEPWNLIRDYLLEKRARQIARAHEELTRHDIIQFVTRTQHLLQVDGLEKEPEALLKQSLEEALTDWNEVLRDVQETPQPEQIHGLRIAGKRLRYRTELLADLGHTSVKPRIKSLKRLQDELGNWHDRYVLLQFIAEFIGRPDFLVDHPQTGRDLLAAMERERDKNAAAVSVILRDAEKARQVWGEPKTGITQE